ncbi:hypothetical protein PYCC9005_005159 [Savitreella phatthalungensis]
MVQNVRWLIDLCEELRFAGDYNTLFCLVRGLTDGGCIKPVREAVAILGTHYAVSWAQLNGIVCIKDDFAAYRKMIHSKAQRPLVPSLGKYN